MSPAERVLEGRSVAVFGAGTAGDGIGNGMAAAIAYARAGAKVTAIDRDEAALAGTLAALTAEGFAAESAICDVTDAGGVEAVIAAILEREGRIDTVHNNVGIFKRGGLLETGPAELSGVLDVNLIGALNAIRAAMPAMLAAGRGTIVNISSIGGRLYYPQMLSYQVSKAALESLTMAVAMEFASRGIRCNVIVAGLIDTPLVRQGVRARYDSDEAMIASLSQASPTGKLGTPWDLANAAVFLASDRSAYINGTALVVDGGAVWRA